MKWVEEFELHSSWMKLDTHGVHIDTHGVHITMMYLRDVVVVILSASVSGGGDG